MLNIILGLVIVLLVGGLIYFVFTKKTADINQTQIGVQYKTDEYGFTFSLPDSWKGYTIVISRWEGYNYGEQGDKLIASGPEIFLRHPLWTTSVPRQDIPIMIFTVEQWNDMQADKFHIGAAPINPSELGRNEVFVFALPARYNFAFLTGFEEVDQIIQSKPLQTFWYYE